MAVAPRRTCGQNPLAVGFRCSVAQLSQRRDALPTSIADAAGPYHVAIILKSLKAANRTEAVIAAGKLGWVFPEIAGS